MSEGVPPEPPEPQDIVTTELVAVIAGVVDGIPQVLTTRDAPRLPSGPLQSRHRSMQAGLRSWVEEQTGHRLGYVEQLYTFADRDRAGSAGRVISVSYLGLTRIAAPDEPGGGWRHWYDFLPWEDRRDGAEPATGAIETLLRDWAEAAPPHERERRRLRCAVSFGLEGQPWSPDLVLQRYELLYEAGLVPESAPDACGFDVPGQRMVHDHRRILATGVARLRTKIQYRPVVFELMGDSFTLGQLQTTVEALAGQHLHKQNFRRLVEQQALVEDTGDLTRETGGRPAKLFRFRRAVLDERRAAGTKLPVPRTR